MNQSSDTQMPGLRSDTSNASPGRTPPDPGRVRFALTLVAAAILLAATQWLTTFLAQAREITPEQTAMPESHHIPAP